MEFDHLSLENFRLMAEIGELIVKSEQIIFSGMIRVILNTLPKNKAGMDSGTIFIGRVISIMNILMVFNSSIESL